MLALIMAVLRLQQPGQQHSHAHLQEVQQEVTGCLAHILLVVAQSLNLHCRANSKR
jgi:hypothetical protein